MFSRLYLLFGSFIHVDSPHRPLQTEEPWACWISIMTVANCSDPRIDSLREVKMQEETKTIQGASNLLRPGLHIICCRLGGRECRSTLSLLNNDAEEQSTCQTFTKLEVW